MAERLPRLCMIGSTGTGKSASCNSLCSLADKFHSSSEPSSVTFDTTLYDLHWFGSPDETMFTLIDTPGLGDSEGRDA